MDNTTKIALLLGLTMMGLLGGISYLRSEEQPLIRVSPVAKLHERADLFREWMKKYNKSYLVDEHHVRFNIWNKAYDFVQEHNAAGKSWQVDTNMFADLTNEEFAALHLGYNHDPNRVRENVKYLNASEAPEGTSWDWRKKGAVSPVKDQGSCGSCYTFSSAAALEGTYFINKGSLIELSSQQLLDCTSSQGNQGCNGGLMDNCFKYTQSKGIMKLSDYTYKGKAGTCAYSASKVVYKNTAYTDVPANDFTQLRVAVKKQPTSVAVEADNDAFKLYKSGIISDNCGTELDHAILAVGYGSGFWIVKNSWGASWGEEGYVRIASGSQNDGAGVCGINSVCSYPTL
jgi:C1A family cysteine protease